MLKAKVGNFINYVAKVDKVRTNLKIDIAKVDNKRVALEAKVKRDLTDAEKVQFLNDVQVLKDKASAKLKKIGRFPFTTEDKKLVESFKTASGNKRNTLINAYAETIGFDFSITEKATLVNALSGKRATTSFERFNGVWTKDRGNSELLNVLYSVLVEIAIAHDIVNASDYGNELPKNIVKLFDKRNAEIAEKERAKAERIAKKKAKKAEKEAKKAVEKAVDDSKVKGRRA